MNEKKGPCSNDGELAATYKRSNYTNTDALIAEALKEVFEAFEAHYAALIKRN